MKTLQELVPLIIDWAQERNILNPENADKQRLKLLEEVGETAGAHLKGKTDEVKDGLGDIFVVVTILAAQLGEELVIDLEDFARQTEEAKSFIPDIPLWAILYDMFQDNTTCSDLIHGILATAHITNLDITECANLAWEEIKYRKGKTVNGTFIKAQ